MTNMYITAAETVIIESTNVIKEIPINEFPAHEMAIYMNHIIDQLNMCWGIIRNREAKE